jgi:hypothetical protein
MLCEGVIFETSSLYIEYIAPLYKQEMADAECIGHEYYYCLLIEISSAAVEWGEYSLRSYSQFQLHQFF